MILQKSKIYESNFITSLIPFRDLSIHRELNYLIENNYKKDFAWREPYLGYYEPTYYCYLHDRVDMLKYLWKKKSFINFRSCFDEVLPPRLIYNFLKHDFLQI